jgi:hypothetical protein
VLPWWVMRISRLEYRPGCQVSWANFRLARDQTGAILRHESSTPSRDRSRHLD